MQPAFFHQLQNLVHCGIHEYAHLVDVVLLPDLAGGHVAQCVPGRPGIKDHPGKIGAGDVQGL